MQIRELIEKLEKRFPLEVQEEFDNSGFQLGNPEDELKNIMVCLEVTEESIDEAINKNCNLIISHHPLIFNPIRNILTDFKGKKIQRLIKNEITLYSIHTPVDMNGLNEYIFNKLGFKTEGKIVLTNGNLGYGDYANIKVSSESLVDSIKNNLNIKNVIKYGNSNSYSKIGLITGSGMDFIKEVKDLGIDLYITGDICHHDAMDSIEQGIDLIDISHEGSEKYFAEFMSKYLIENNIFDKDRIFEYYNSSKYILSIQ